MWIRAGETEPHTWNWLIARLPYARSKSKSIRENISKLRLPWRVASDTSLSTARGKRPGLIRILTAENGDRAPVSSQGLQRAGTRGQQGGGGELRAKCRYNFFVSQLASRPFDCLTKPRHTLAEEERKQREGREAQERSGTRGTQSGMFSALAQAQLRGRTDPSPLSHGHPRAFQCVLCSKCLSGPC